MSRNKEFFHARQHCTGTESSTVVPGLLRAYSMPINPNLAFVISIEEHGDKINPPLLVRLDENNSGKVSYMWRSVAQRSAGSNANSGVNCMEKLTTRRELSSYVKRKPVTICRGGRLQGFYLHFPPSTHSCAMRCSRNMQLLQCFRSWHYTSSYETQTDRGGGLWRKLKTMDVQVVLSDVVGGQGAPWPGSGLGNIFPPKSSDSSPMAGH